MFLNHCFFMLQICSCEVFLSNSHKFHIFFGNFPFLGLELIHSLLVMISFFSMKTDRCYICTFWPLPSNKNVAVNPFSNLWLACRKPFFIVTLTLRNCVVARSFEFCFCIFVSDVTRPLTLLTILTFRELHVINHFAHTSKIAIKKSSKSFIWRARRVNRLKRNPDIQKNSRTKRISQQNNLKVITDTNDPDGHFMFHSPDFYLERRVDFYLL